MTLEVLNNAIVEGLQTIEGVQTVSTMATRKDRITLPAIIIELDEVEPGKDAGTGELGLLTHWQARIITNERSGESAAWGILQAALLWLFNFNWPELNIGRPIIKSAAPDHFTPEFQGHRIWLIEWANELRIGENVWDGEGVTPEVVNLYFRGDFQQRIELNS